MGYVKACLSRRYNARVVDANDNPPPLEPAARAGDSSQTTQPGRTVGSYVLLERLGAGGVGEVWKARDRVLNRIIALKFIASPRHGSSPLKDLLREARGASAM